jgi:CBS-domain-containing membrane protein
MSDEIFSCMDEDDLELAVQLMEDHQVRRLIVQDRGGQLVGLLSLADLARHVETSTLSAEALSGISQPSLGSSH